MNQSFKAGLARIDITPPPGTIINGDFIVRRANSIHDSLYVAAMVMKKDFVWTAIVLADVCAMSKSFLDEVKRDISMSTPLKAENILIASTHAHSTGSVADIFLSSPDFNYMAQLRKKIVEAVAAAKENIEDAKVAFGRVEAPEHAVCRRYFMKKGYKPYNPVTNSFDKVKTNPLGDEHLIETRVAQTDIGLNYVAIKSLDDRWLGLLANYSLHYVGDCAPDSISSDYFGKFRTMIAEDLGAGEDFVAIMSNGTSGDVNIWDFIEPGRYPKKEHEKSTLIARDLARKVAQSIHLLDWQHNPALDAAYAEVEIKVRKPSTTDFEISKRVMDDTDYSQLQVYENGRIIEDSIRRIYAREQVLLNEYPDRILFPVQAIKLGSGIIGGLGGEFFSKTGLLLKHEFGKYTFFTVTMANGYVGYVPPENEMRLGGYETWRCRTSFLEREAEQIIRQKLSVLVNKIR
ncbi:MAG: hypothetical protein JNK79_17155 [Chitinophagaceae bacterium]|nr:hypothetical protein [Chitinophagaceae bacterium]